MNLDIAISFYQIMDLFFVAPLIITVLFRTGIGFRRVVSPAISLFYLLFLLMVVVGFFHIFQSPSDRGIVGDISYERIFLASWPEIVGIIIFPASLILLKSITSVESIYKIGILAGSLLFFEYFVGLMGLLPDDVIYYSLNYRGGFRSVSQSGDLFVGLILIFSTASALYYFLTRRHIGYLALVVMFSYLNLATLNRASMIGLIIMALWLFWFSGHGPRVRIVMYGGLLAIAWLLYAELTEIGFTSVGNLFDIGQIYRTSGTDYFDLSSGVDRLGAMIRGFDVFLYTPVIGAGPGNVIDYMSSSIVPRYIGPEGYGEGSFEFYWLIWTNQHPTNTHNIVTNLLAEYGIVVVFLAFAGVAAARSVWSSFRKTIATSNYPESVARLTSFAALIGYGAYFGFQAWPEIYGMLFLLLRISMLSSEQIEMHASSTQKTERILPIPDINPTFGE